MRIPAATKTAERPVRGGEATIFFTLSLYYQRHRLEGGSVIIGGAVYFESDSLKPQEFRPVGSVCLNRQNFAASVVLLRASWFRWPLLSIGRRTGPGLNAISEFSLQSQQSVRRQEFLCALFALSEEFLIFYGSFRVSGWNLQFLRGNHGFHAESAKESAHFGIPRRNPKRTLDFAIYRWTFEIPRTLCIFHGIFPFETLIS
jgi:hypothetical protein